MRVSTLDHLISINLMYLCRRKYACVVAVLFFEAEPTAKKNVQQIAYASYYYVAATVYTEKTRRSHICRRKKPTALKLFICSGNELAMSS